MAFTSCPMPPPLMAILGELAGSIHVSSSGKMQPHLPFVVSGSHVSLAFVFLQRQASHVTIASHMTAMLAMFQKYMQGPKEPCQRIPQKARGGDRARQHQQTSTFNDHTAIARNDREREREIERECAWFEFWPTGCSEQLA